MIVHEGEGRGNDRRQRIDIYLNFIGAFEVPAHIVTPAEVGEQRRQQEEQAAKEARSKELEKARYEKRKAEKRAFTARKRRGFSRRKNWKPRKNGLHITGSGKRNGGRNAKPQNRPSRLRRNP